MSRLTDVDREALRFIAADDTGHPILAREVAAALGWNPRTGGGRLGRLVKLGLLTRHVARAATARTEPLRGYALTTQGRDVARNLPAWPLAGAPQTIEELLDRLHAATGRDSLWDPAVGQWVSHAWRANPGPIEIRSWRDTGVAHGVPRLYEAQVGVRKSGPHPTLEDALHEILDSVERTSPA